MGRGRQVADAYIEVHGDLSEFRDDLNAANGTMEDWAKSQSDTFTQAWGKRMRSQMNDQWNSVISAMESGERLDFNRMIDAFDPDDHVAAFAKIDEMMKALVKQGKLNEDQMDDMSSAISRQIGINEKLQQLESGHARDRTVWGQAHQKMMAERAVAMQKEAANEKMWGDAHKNMMTERAEAMRRQAAAQAVQMQRAIAMNEQWKKSFSGITRAAREFDLDQKFKNLSFAMATNDWSRIAQGAKNMNELRNRTTQTTLEMVKLGRMTQDQFAAVQVQLRKVGADLGGFNVKFADSNKASARHARDWTVINKMVGSAGKKFAGFTGLNVLTDIFNEGARFFQDLDRNAVQIGKMALMVGSLGSAVVSMLGGVALVGQDLAKIGQISILGPAFLTGAAISAGVLIAALKDMGTVLADLKPRFEELQNSISTSFWAVAEAPIRNLVDTLLPTLSAKLSETATGLGGMFAALTNSLASISTDDISVMFDRMNAGIANATGAMDPLVQAFNTMGLVGSEYFERFGTWITEISTQFNNFIQTAAADGRLNSWIEEAISSLQSVWSILGSAVGIFNSIGAAAEAAGIGGLFMLATNLEKVAEIMNSPGFQTTLTQLFAGAAEATRSIGTALGELGPAIESFMPTLAAGLGTIGQTVARVIDYIGQIMENPLFQKGLTDFLTGVQKGVQALAPAIGPMGDSLGQIGSLLGQVAGQVGSLVSAFVVNLSPILDQITGAFARITFAAGPEIERLIGSIAEVAGGFVDTLLPPLEKLIMTILPLIAPAFEALTPIFEALQGVLGPIIERIQQLVDMIAPVLVPAIEKIAAAMAPVIEVIGVVVDAILSVLVPILGTLLIGVINNVVGVFEGFAGIVSGIVTIVVGVFQGFRDIFVGIFTGDFGLALNGLLGIFGSIFTGIWEVVKGALELLWNGVQLIFIGKLIGGIKTGLTTIGAFFKSSWDDIVRLIGKVWDDIINFFTKGFSNAQSTTTKGLNAIADFFKKIWDDISRLVGAAWTKLVDFITKGINTGKTVVTDGLTNIGNFFKSIWSTITSTVSNAWNALIGFISNGISRAISFVSNGLTNIGNFFRNIWNAVANTVSNAWNQVTNFISNGISRAISWVSNGLNNMLNFFRNGWTNMSNATSTGINNVINWVAGIPGRILGALGNLGSTLRNQGNAIINGFLDGIKNAFEGVKNFVGGIANWIADHKGPISYDKVLLIPAGNAIMEGLGKGLRDKLGMLKATLGNVTDTMTDTVTAAFAKSKMYVAGADAAMGLADGLKSKKSALAGALAVAMPSASSSVSASLIGSTSVRNQGVGSPTPTDRAGMIIEAGAIVVSTPTKNPEIVASKVIDEFANYSNL